MSNLRMRVGEVKHQNLEINYETPTFKTHVSITPKEHGHWSVESDEDALDSNCQTSKHYF